MKIRMQIETLSTADDVAARAAQIIARDARSAVAARGMFVMAVSGGRTPWQMLRALANEDVPWAQVHVIQVDERIAPAGDPTATSLIFARVCSPTLPFRRAKSTRCQSKGKIWNKVVGITPRFCNLFAATQR